MLRTTALLPALAEAHPRASITWITRREARPLLEGNPYITEILDYGEDALLQLRVRTFDRVINLDAGKTSGACRAANASRKDGSFADARGYVQPTNAAARTWLEMGVFDDLKRQGTKTYQDRWRTLSVCPRPHRYVLELTEDERERGRLHLKSSASTFTFRSLASTPGQGAAGAEAMARGRGISS